MRWLLMLVSLLVAVSVGVLTYNAVKNYLPFNPQNTVTIYSNGGGEIDSFQENYGKMVDEGKYLKVNGVCASACTYFLTIFPPERVCATSRAKFLFHGIYNMLGFSKEVVSIYHPVVYPPFVLDLLKKKGFDGTKDVDKTQYPSGLIELTREELKINAC